MPRCGFAAYAFLAVLAAPAAGLPTLVTARSAHLMSIEQSRRAYPVVLRAVVTYYDPYIDTRHAALFVADESGAIFVKLLSAPRAFLKPGTLVEITGFSGPGDFAPIVDRASVRVIGESRLPHAPPRVSLTALLSGRMDGQWVEVEGVVISVARSGMNVSLRLALGDGTISATTVRDPAVNYESLVDARVLLRGNEAPLFNGRLQMTGARMLFPDITAVRVLEKPPADPFGSPLVPVSGLLRFNPGTGISHRAHVRGRLTLNWPGRLICIEDAGRGLCAETVQTTSARVGEFVDLIGFPREGDFAPTLAEANYRVSGGAQNLEARSVSVADAFSGHRDAQLIRIEGQLLGADRSAPDPAFLLASGNFIFSVTMPRRPGLTSPEPLAGLREGSWLRVTGICSVQASASATSTGAGLSVPKSFRVLLRSPADVVVVRSASWWTPSHSLRVLAAGLILLLIGAIALTRQVRHARKTAADLHREMAERLRAEEATRWALEQMEYQAHHDSLTCLGNRLMFDGRIRDALALAEQDRAAVGLLYIDLDRFKSINDTLGHAAGDLLLKQAAERLKSVSPEHSVLARLGGDEFAFLLTGIAGRAEAQAIAGRVLDALAAPFSIDGMPWHCPASIGLSMFPDDANRAEVLQRNADTALYRAKRLSPGQVVTFDQLMSERAQRSVLIEKALRRALESEGGFSVAYQPQFGGDADLRSFEALLRLNDPLLGPLSPAEFIPVAEEIGLIVEIGEWVLREACRQAAEWMRGSRFRFSIAVNVSPVQLKRGDFPACVRAVLAETGIPPGSLELELTESDVFSQAHQSLLELKAMGARIAVDDFGTGYSSLSSLRGSPVDCVKIDRSFIRDSACTPGTLPFIRTIVALARSLGMKTVAEGVETVGQMAAVKSAGCDLIQGYLLAKPLSPVDAFLLIRQQAEAAQEQWDRRIPVAAA